jgi:hypothetical protein
MAALLPHQERVVAEQHELQERLTKLAQFIRSPAFTKVPQAEHVLLREQLAVQQELNRILLARIALWT